MPPMNCRNIACKHPATGYGRIYLVYEDGPVLDVDYTYCNLHLELHRQNHANSGLNIQFFDTLEGVRHEDV